ncbi:MAG TPA: AtzE family amidohydrolase [Gaiellaceae bacterium]|nr:AtzE family amidohydrolase [Gaiellaceae bacterium]
MSTNHATALLERMGAALRDDPRWAGIDPAPAFSPDPRPIPRVGADASNNLLLATPRRPAGDVLAAIEELQPQLNAFTSVFHDAADAIPGRGPLAGMPFAVKDLIDIEGVVTLAGSVAKAGDAPASADATAVGRMRDAGGLLVGATNMDEFAYGFTTENSHYGPTRNPHDLERVAGGSSGGSAAAVAAGLVAAALGTDTNGSVRIPAAFCGIYGLRPTQGLVPTAGATLFAPSFDVVGPFAGTVAELAAVLDVIAAPAEPFTAFLEGGLEGLRVARASGELWDAASPEVLDAAGRVADALGAADAIDLPEVGLARAAAIVITAAEGADQHQVLLRESPELVDRRVRDRFLAGLGVPATDYLAAQRFRAWWQALVLPLLDDVDVLVLPTVACTAPLIDQETIEVGGVTLPTGAVLGRFTQPVSFIGLPALSVPVAGPSGLPIGVQLVGRPFGDGALLRAAAALEASGVIGAVTPAIRRSESWT